MKTGLLLLCSLNVCLLFGQGIALPPQFEDVQILTGLQDPSSIAFAPDGRLFISERILGDLRIAEFDSSSQSWSALPTPFYSFDVPSSEHRSSGLRGITFDPDFENTGYIYSFYMKNNPRHNRVVRIQANPSNPNVALAGETLIMEVPFNSSSSSGSHNGGDLVFGHDAKLYFTTGDGWNEGDNVQSLSTFTGKLFRVNADGSIPTDNPFYDTASENYRAIYCLGLRNPYTVSYVTGTGNIYVNDAVLSNKATVYQIMADGSTANANFGHDGYGGIGTQTAQWTNTSVGGAKLITGGAWYPQSGYWPAEYRGSYFAAMWGSNSGNAGHIVQVESESNPVSTVFASGVIVPPRHKPVMTEIGPDGNLYYLLTDYETGNGEVHMIRYTGQAVAGAPSFNPPPGQFDDPVSVAIASATPNATVHFTTDGSLPDVTSPIYGDSIMINEATTLRAIAFADSALASAISTGEYFIGPIPNNGPVADAGPTLIVEVNKVVTLNGSASFDPDGSPLELMESWKQIDGPATVLLDEDETVANFTPMLTGTYTFRILVEDVEAAKDSAEARITVVDQVPDVLAGLLARWSCEEGKGVLLEDTSPNAHRGMLDGAAWSPTTADSSEYALAFDGNTDRVDLGNLDISGAAMTICFWAKIRSFSQHDARFISKASGQNDTEHKWMVSTLNGDELRFRLNTDVGGTATLISAPDVLELDTWMHLAASYDGSTMRLYRDGAVVTSRSKTGNIGTDPAVDAAIGNQPANASGGARPFDGWMDEVRIYGRALSEMEINMVRTVAVEKCNCTVTNDRDAGNGSFRRAIACAATGDSISFENISDTIVILSAPIDINNGMSVIGNNTPTPVIYNTLNQPGVSIATNINVHFAELEFSSLLGPVLYNGGTLDLDAVTMTVPKSSLLLPVQNTGYARIIGAFSLRKH